MLRRNGIVPRQSDMINTVVGIYRIVLPTLEKEATETMARLSNVPFEEGIHSLPKTDGIPVVAAYGSYMLIPRSAIPFSCANFDAFVGFEIQYFKLGVRYFVVHPAFNPLALGVFTSRSAGTHLLTAQEKADKIASAGDIAFFINLPGLSKSDSVEHGIRDKSMLKNIAQHELTHMLQYISNPRLDKKRKVFVYDKLNKDIEPFEVIPGIDTLVNQYIESAIGHFIGELYYGKPWELKNADQALAKQFARYLLQSLVLNIRKDLNAKEKTKLLGLGFRAIERHEFDLKKIQSIAKDHKVYGKASNLVSRLKNLDLLKAIIATATYFNSVERNLKEKNNLTNEFYNDLLDDVIISFLSYYARDMQQDRLKGI
jgi:hypothetical protein